MRTKKYVLMLLSCLLVFASFPIIASSEENTEENTSETDVKPGQYSTKDEVIYGKLGLDGNPKNIYVVNSFHVTKKGEIIDYGNYSDVRNLTDLSEIKRTENNNVHFQAKEDFYYQGELENKSLPWNISITYLLNGKEVDPNQLAGQSGNLEIHIETSANKNIDPLFFEYYLLQISLTFDPTIYKDIQAPKGTEANEGKYKLMNFNVMPEQEEVIVVSTHVNDLEMEPITISAVPANIGFDRPDTDDLADDMQELSDAIRDIHSGFAELKNGISDLSGGASELSKGANAYGKGLNKLNQSSSGLIDGSEKIRDAFQQMSKAIGTSPDMPNLDGLDVLPKGLRDMAMEIRNFSKTLHTLKEAVNNLPNQSITSDQIQEVRNALNDNKLVDVVNQLEVTYNAAQEIKKISKAIPEDVTARNEQMAKHLETIAASLEKAMANLADLDDLTNLQAGLTTLASEYEAFHNGLVTYTNGVSSLAGSYQELNTGTKELSNGMMELKGGANKLYNGTNELQANTSDLSSQMQSEIDKFMEEFDYSDFEPISFVSNKNKNIGVVQFVLETESIEIEEQEETTEEEEVKKSIWDRFLDLFK